MTILKVHAEEEKYRRKGGMGKEGEGKTDTCTGGWGEDEEKEEGVEHRTCREMKRQGDGYTGFSREEEGKSQGPE